MACFSCSEQKIIRADSKLEEPTRPERSNLWQAIRADSKICEPTRSEELMCAQRGEPTLITRSWLEALSEPTQRHPSRLEHRTQASNGYIFNLLSNWKFSNGYLSSHNGQEASKASLKGKKAPLEEKKKRGRKEEKKRRRKKGLHFNLNLSPSKTQGEPRRTKSCYHLLNKNQKASWRNQEDHLKLKKLIYKIFFKHFKLQHPTTRVCLKVAFLTYLFLYWLVGYPVKPLRFLVSLWKPR